MAWEKIVIDREGTECLAHAPIIISASRSTDIPAFFADDFFRSLDRGYSLWRNPFNNRESVISYAKMRFIVFWSKNPYPLLKHLPALEGVGYYIQFTLNDYEKEGYERGLQSLDKRIADFQEISQSIGKERVIWRFDPLILSDTIGIDNLLDRIEYIADRLCGYTERLVFSFVDIEDYKKVKSSFSRRKIAYRDWTEEDMMAFASGLQQRNRKWGFTLASCSEKIDLSDYGISHNKCVDDALIRRISPHDSELMSFLDKSAKDKGQRKHCACAPSKDIGMYNTCHHGCIYCYATYQK